MGALRRWYLSLFSPNPTQRELEVYLSVTLDQAVVLRAAAQAVWNRKLQSYQTVTDAMSHATLEHEIAQLERCLDVIDQAVMKRRDQK